MIRDSKDLTGRIFGAWTVIKRIDVQKGERPRWLCRCTCGNTRSVMQQSLLNGSSKGCGCTRKKNPRRGADNPLFVHGGKGTRLYECWRHMRYRCENPSNQAYEFYGARGISVCSEWHDFALFRKWAEQNGYDDSLTLDRIDVDGDYEPSNCRWADSKTQMNNRRNTPHFEMDGKSMTMSEWSEITGIPRSTIYNRMKKGDTFQEAIKRGKGGRSC